MNDMKEWLPDFLSEFHRDYMKPLGFTKNGRTFSRDMASYWERYNFQGSRRNYPGERNWRFYINVGVEFKDIEPREYWSGFAHTHMTTRLEFLVWNAPHQWEYNLATDKVELARGLVFLLTKTGQGMAANIVKLREMYVADEYSRPRWFSS